MPTVITTNTEMAKLDQRIASRIGDLHNSRLYESRHPLPARLSVLVGLAVDH
jgi:hypothetical protein